ncbi:ABC transporter permease subunit [Clostridium sp.]|uniref:ABC transporter permease subunit n=1 Tax=Clostridium sp. TaxID=1506 RepID=UPI0034638F70
MKLFQVELFKLVKSKKYLIFCLAIIMLMVLKTNMVYNYTQNQLPEIKLANNEKLLVDYKAKLRDENIEEESKTNYEAEIKRIEEENKELKEEIRNPNYNWRDKLNKKNKILKEKKEQAEMSLKYNEVEDINGEISVNEYLLENNIEPRKLYEMYSFIDIGEIISFISMPFLPIMIMILGYDSISGEMQFSTIKLLATKPIKREKIILMKFLSLFCISVITVIILELLMLLITSVIFNSGDSMYPILVGTTYGVDNLDNISAIKNSTYIITAYSYLIKVIILQVIYIFATTAFSILVSTFFVSNGICLMASVIGMVLFNAVTFVMPQKAFSFIYPYLFTSYAIGGEVIDGKINLLLSTTKISEGTGAIVCFIWGFAFIGLAYKRFVNRDIVV